MSEAAQRANLTALDNQVQFWRRQAEQAELFLEVSGLAVEWGREGSDAAV